MFVTQGIIYGFRLHNINKEVSKPNLEFIYLSKGQTTPQKMKILVVNKLFLKIVINYILNLEFKYSYIFEYCCNYKGIVKLFLLFLQKIVNFYFITIFG